MGQPFSATFFRRCITIRLMPPPCQLLVPYAGWSDRDVTLEVIVEDNSHNLSPFSLYNEKT